jgi:hypothetical protein
MPDKSTQTSLKDIETLLNHSWSFYPNLTSAQKVAYDKNQASRIHIVPTKYKKKTIPRTWKSMGIPWGTTAGRPVAWHGFTKHIANTKHEAMDCT